MKVVLINPRFNNSTFLEGDYFDLDEAFDDFIKFYDLDYSIFARLYGDWAVYTKGTPHLEYQGIVAELLTAIY